MQSFFLTIIIVFTAAVVLIVYYSLRQYADKKKQRRRISLIRKKLYEDDRIYFQSRLRALIPQLKDGQLQWLIISSKKMKQEKLEITYSSLSGEIELKDRARSRKSTEIGLLSQLGAVSCLVMNEINIISAPLNSKIISDIIYFIFEEIFNLKPAQNLKISTSGDLT